MSLHLFKFKETLPSNYIGALPKYFRVSSTTTFDIIILRLLTATLKVEKKGAKPIDLKYNYCAYPKYQVTRKSSKPIKAVIQPFNFDIYTKYSTKFYGRNVNFYNNLLHELAYYFWYSNEGFHQSAFVNLYRTLEYISYSFPLIHSSHYGNFTGSFNALKSYFTGDKISEITFFDNFVKKLLNGTPYLALQSDFYFSNPDAAIADSCYDSFEALLSTKDWLKRDKLNHNLAVENTKLITLFKQVRNRYFHYAVGGQRNLHNSDLKDPDFFFKCVNEQFLNWIAFIFAQVVVESLDNSIIK